MSAYLCQSSWEAEGQKESRKKGKEEEAKHPP